ncbi:hypothetical protein BDZ45DRAFT_730309 [Acephala macrosclerotiorum]|nr:hypothetical protein BDZ45DRAFT_730309 [Acephala macrosclerotiorum]
MNHPQQGCGSNIVQGSHGRNYSSISGQPSGCAQRPSQTYGGLNSGLLGQSQDDVGFTVTKITKDGSRIQLIGRRHGGKHGYRSPCKDAPHPSVQLSQIQHGRMGEVRSQQRAVHDQPPSRAKKQPRPAGRFFEQKVQSGDAYVVHQVMAALIDAGYGPNSKWGETDIVENKVEALGEDVGAQDEDVDMKHD